MVSRHGVITGAAGQHAPMNPTHFRFAGADAAAGGVDASLASDVPYKRNSYTEVLTCTPEAVDLSRAGDGLPLLLHHDSTRLIGRVYDIRADGHKVRGRLTFFDTAEGREARAMVDGGHRELSIGYRVIRRDEPKGGTVVVLRWVLDEVSIVSIPADATIGVARSGLGLPNAATRAWSPAGGGVTSPVSSRRSAGTMADMKTLTPFSLSRTLAALSEPEPGDLSAVLHERVYNATFGADRPGSMREGYPGIAVHVPLDLLARDLNMGTATAGGHLAGQPIYNARDALRGFSIAADFGVEVVDWPAGSLPSVPAISSPIEFGTDIVGVEEEGFRAEGDAVRDADLAFTAHDAVTSTIGGSIKVSRKLMKQGGPQVDALLRRELLRFIGERIDYAVLSGRGAAEDEPMGLCNHPDIVEDDGTDLTWPGVVLAYGPLVGQRHGVRFEALRAVCAPGVASQLGVRTTVSGGEIVLGATYGSIVLGNTLGGIMPCASTQACKDQTLVIGDFSRAAVLIHGGITLIVDPRFNFGSQHRFTVLADIDLAVPQPTAFRRIVGIT